MANKTDFYKSLFLSQQHYLMALREFAELQPNVCCDLFDMKHSHISVMVSHSDREWALFVKRLKNWVLVPRKDITGTCLFSYWLNNTNSKDSISSLINSRVILGRRITSNVDGISSLARCQSSILMNVCMCAEFDPLFAKGLLFLNDALIDDIHHNFPMSNKIHFSEPLLPLFVLNKNLDLTKFMSLDRAARAHVEQSLFTIAS